MVFPDGYIHNTSVLFNNYNTYNVTVISNVVINVGTNVENAVTIQTSNSFGVTYSGTPRHGESLRIAVFNTNPVVNINMTNNSYNPTVASNVLVYAIPSNSIASFTFINRTNWNAAGTNRWELDTVISKQMELVAGSGVTLTTNAFSSTVTVSASGGGSQTPWIQDIDGAGFNIGFVGGGTFSNVSLTTSPGRSQTMMQASSTNNSLTFQIGNNGLVETFAITGSTNDSFRANKSNGPSALPGFTVNSNGVSKAWGDLQVAGEGYFASDAYLFGQDLWMTNAQSGAFQKVIAVSTSPGANTLTYGDLVNLSVRVTATNANTWEFNGVNGAFTGNSTGSTNDLGTGAVPWNTNHVKYLMVKTGLGESPGPGKVLTAVGTAGQVAWSNAPNSGIHTFLDSFAATNSTVNTNITVDMSVKTVRLSLTNNASFTNWTGNSATTAGSFAVVINPQLVNRTIVWPSFSTPTLGFYFRTNSGSTMWTTLTNGVEYWLMCDRIDTNIALTISAFQ
jgi:hypothetical protein